MLTLASAPRATPVIAEPRGAIKRPGSLPKRARLKPVQSRAVTGSHGRRHAAEDQARVDIGVADHRPSSLLQNFTFRIVPSFATSNASIAVAASRGTSLNFRIRFSTGWKNDNAVDAAMRRYRSMVSSALSWSASTCTRAFCCKRRLTAGWFTNVNHSPVFFSSRNSQARARLQSHVFSESWASTAEAQDERSEIYLRCGAQSNPLLYASIC